VTASAVLTNLGFIVSPAKTPLQRHFQDFVVIADNYSLDESEARKAFSIFGPIRTVVRSFSYVLIRFDDIRSAISAFRSLSSMKNVGMEEKSMKITECEFVAKVE
jgi:hypothetical protein